MGSCHWAGHIRCPRRRSGRHFPAPAKNLPCPAAVSGKKFPVVVLVVAAESFVVIQIELLIGPRLIMASFWCRTRRDWGRQVKGGHHRSGLIAGANHARGAPLGPPTAPRLQRHQRQPVTQLEIRVNRMQLDFGPPDRSCSGRPFNIVIARVICR